MSDSGLAEAQLHYVRDRQKREVDFLITIDNVPILLVEAKLSPEADALAPLNFFGNFFNVPHRYCVVMKPDVFKKMDAKTWFVSARRFFNLLW